MPRSPIWRRSAPRWRTSSRRSARGADGPGRRRPGRAFRATAGLLLSGRRAPRHRHAISEIALVGRRHRHGGPRMRPSPSSSSPTSSRARTTSWSPSPRRPTTASASDPDRGARAIGRGLGAGPFHSQNPEGVFAHVPGLKVVCPGTVQDAYDLLRAPRPTPTRCSSSSTGRLYRSLRAPLARGRRSWAFGHAPRGPPRPPPDPGDVRRHACPAAWPPRADGELGERAGGRRPAHPGAARHGDGDGLVRRTGGPSSCTRTRQLRHRGRGRGPAERRRRSSTGHAPSSGSPRPTRRPLRPAAGGCLRAVPGRTEAAVAKCLAV